MRDDCLFKIPGEHFIARRSRSAAINEGYPPSARGAGVSGCNAVKPRQETQPPGPMRIKKIVGQRLNEIGEDRGAQWTMKKYDFVHRDRSVKPGLINFPAPLRRWRVLKRRFEDKVLVALDRR